MIRYDNLTPAVIRVALGRERLENPRFVRVAFPTMAMTRSSVSPASTGRTRRAVSRERSAGSVAVT